MPKYEARRRVSVENWYGMSNQLLLGRTSAVNRTLNMEDSVNAHVIHGVVGARQCQAVRRALHEHYMLSQRANH